MKKRMLMAGSSLIFVLAACGGTPQLKIATPQEKASATANIGKLSTQLQSLNLAGKASSKLAATAVNGSLEFDCPQGGKATLTFSSDSTGGTATGTFTGTMKLESASCVSGDITLTDVNLTLKYDGGYGTGNFTFKTIYDGGVTIKDAKDTIKLTFTNMTYDSKITTEKLANGKTKYDFSTTINGTSTANDNFITYTNEVAKSYSAEF
jgi:hypothetical protein